MKSEFMTIYGRYRKAAGLTQERAAELLGVTVRSVAAWERGVGTVITGYFDEEKITRLLNLPENQKVGCVIGLGYPDEEPAAPKRKSVEDLLTSK